MGQPDRRRRRYRQWWIAIGATTVAAALCLTIFVLRRPSAPDLDEPASARTNKPIPTAAAAEPQTVRDAMWMWGHYKGSYDKKAAGRGWGLPGDSPITPVEGARSMGVPNMIMIRYSGKPKPPFDDYALPFRTLKKVMWSVTGMGGVTSKKERDSVFALAAKMPNITGVFMDDFLHYRAQRGAPQWLAKNNVRFPVLLTLTLPSPAAVDRLELVQSAWRTGDYRSGRFTVELSTDKKNFKQVVQGTMPKAPGARAEVALPKTKVRAVRIRIIGTHDTKKAESCGLSRVRLWQGKKRLDLKGVVVEASSQFPGHPPGNVLVDEAVENDQPIKPVPAAMSVEQLRQLRKRLTVNGRKLDLGVVLYTTQLDRRITPHLKHCDIVSLWTWRAVELANLEKNFARLQTLVPGKRILLGLYMWDFGTKKPMPVDLMKKQCELALKWLRQGRIEGMIFLATNICDLDLETVNWTRRWIAKVGGQPLRRAKRGQATLWDCEHWWTAPLQNWSVGEVSNG